MSKEMTPHEINVRTVVRMIAMMFNSSALDKDFSSRAMEWMQQMPEGKPGYQLEDQKPPQTAA